MVAQLFLLATVDELLAGVLAAMLHHMRVSSVITATRFLIELLKSF